MLRIANILDGLDAADRPGVAYEVYRTYGSPHTDDAEMLLEQRRASERERQARLREESRDNGGGVSRDNANVSRDSEGLFDPCSRSTVLKKEAKKDVLTPDTLSKAKRLLKTADFEFLQACPEPFKASWLAEPDWWVSLCDGYPKINALKESSKCMAYVQGKFSTRQMERLNLRERLRRWIAKADAWRENGEERKAVRR